MMPPGLRSKDGDEGKVGEGLLPGPEEGQGRVRKSVEGRIGGDLFPGPEGGEGKVTSCVSANQTV